MKIAIIAPGSRGDIQPYVALGKGLMDAGYTIRIISNMDHDNLVASYGLEFWPIEVDIQDYVQSEKMRTVLENGGLITSLAEMGRGMKRSATLLASRSLEGCQAMDLILVGISGLFTGLALAEKTGLPLLQAYNLPITPTGAFPGVLTPQLSAWFGGRLTRLSHHITRQLLWQAYRPAEKHIRKHVLELPASPFLGPFSAEILRQLPILYGFSPSVIPHPEDWPDDIHITGYWYLEAAIDWKPSEELVQFLSSEPTPIYIGFGSMSSRNPQATADLVFDALERTGQRAVVFSGWGGLGKSNLPASVLMVDSLPHTWLFSRVKAVIHHGGAGTTAAGLRAGIPSLIIPYHGDQPFWGQLVASLGVGPTPIPRKNLTVDMLSDAIKNMVSDQDMRQKAAILGARIRAENGIGRAVEIIRQIEVNIS